MEAIYLSVVCIYVRNEKEFTKLTIFMIVSWVKRCSLSRMQRGQTGGCSFISSQCSLIALKELSRSDFMIKESAESHVDKARKHTIFRLTMQVVRTSNCYFLVKSL